MTEWVKPARSQAWERQRGYADKRVAVLSTAADVFCERGYHGATLDEVALRLEVTKPTVYYYFSSKEELLFECARQGLAQILSATTERSGQTGEAVDRLVACMQVYAEAMTQRFGMCSIRVGLDPLSPEHRAALLAMRHDIQTVFQGLVVAGIREGSMVACDARLAATTLLGSLSSIAYWYQDGGPLTQREIAQRCIHLIAFGLCARRGTTHNAGADTGPAAPFNQP